MSDENSRAQQAFHDLRDVGGSLVLDGRDRLTANADGAKHFEDELFEAAGKDARVMDYMLDTIEEAIKDARLLQEANANPLVMKRPSKPMINVFTIGQVEVNFVWRTKKP